MKYDELAASILANIGGEENIEDLVHCITRLRFTIKDTTKVNDVAIRELKGVITTVNQGTNYQVVIGNEVAKVYKEITNKNNIKGSGKIKIEKNIVKSLLDVISGCMVPIIPALAAAGMLNVVLVLLKNFNLVSATSSTYALINTMANAGFYFIPILVAVTASKKFNCNTFLAIVCVGALIHPNFNSLVSAGEKLTLFGIPVALGSYSAQIAPALLTVWFMSIVENICDKYIPSMIKYFAKPLVIVLVTCSVSFVILAPLGYYISEILAMVIYGAYDKIGWVVIPLLSAILPFLVMTGTHKAISPIALQQYATLGYEPLYLISFLAFNFSQGAAALAVAFKTKNKELKQVASAAAISGIVAGITEPALYGITIKLKKPLYASMIGAAAAGIYSGLVHLKIFTYAGPALVTLPAFISGSSDNNFINACIAAAISVIVTFIMTIVLGWDESLIEKEDISSVPSKKKKLVKEKIAAPVTGKIVPIDEVDDELYKTEVMGKTCAIIPRENKIYAPVDGKVISIFPSNHAFSIVSDTGAEILIHIGIDTVKLNGRHFDPLVEEGDTIKKGQLIMNVDFNKITSEGYNITTFTIVTNSKDYLESILDVNAIEVEHGENIIYLI